MLTLALKNDIEVGVGYAIWSGVGTALIAIIGVLAFSEQASVMKFLCIAMIIMGVVGLKLNTTSNDEQPGENVVSTSLPDSKSDQDSDSPIRIEATNSVGAKAVSREVNS